MIATLLYNRKQRHRTNHPRVCKPPARPDKSPSSAPKHPASLPEGCSFLTVDSPFSSQSLKAIATQAAAPYTLLYTKDTILNLGMFALERMVHILNEQRRRHVYADHYQLKGGQQTIAPRHRLSAGVAARRLRLRFRTALPHWCTEGCRRPYEGRLSVCRTL